MAMKTGGRRRRGEGEGRRGALGGVSVSSPTPFHAGHGRGWKGGKRHSSFLDCTSHFFVFFVGVAVWLLWYEDGGPIAGSGGGGGVLL